MSDDARLEEVFRSGLQRHADDVDTTAPVVTAARAAARRRRRSRVVAGLAASAVAAAMVTAVVVRGDGPSPGGGDPDPVALDPPAVPQPATAWRTETWRNLAVDVPADWGWGTAPITMSSGGSRLLCGGPGWTVRPDGEELVNPERDTPWVGRPVMLSDDCLGEPFPPASAPYVWLGAAVPVGTVDVGGGFTQETVEVAGTTLTVATDDPALTRSILASARAAQGCEPRLDAAPAVDSMLTEGLRDPGSAQVCAYRRDGDGPSYDLAYAATLDREQAAAYHAQVYDGGFESSPQFCARGRAELVLVTVTGDDPYGDEDVSQATVVDPVCQEVQGAPGMVSPLSDAGMEAWSHNGVRASLSAFARGPG